jgi:HTH-type transcriptional regulator/antitoxin HipB
MLTKNQLISQSINIGKTIRSIRKKAGLTQQQLAEFAGIGKTAVFDIEKGKSTVQLDTVLKILSILNIKIKLETPFFINEIS